MDGGRGFFSSLIPAQQKRLTPLHLRASPAQSCDSTLHVYVCVCACVYSVAAAEGLICMSPCEIFHLSSYLPGGIGPEHEGDSQQSLLSVYNGMYCVCSTL